MPRTEEQREADELLSQAIDVARVAYYPNDAKAMLGTYVVVYVEQKMDEEGEITHSYGSLIRNGSASSVEVVGLLEIASFDIKAVRRSEPDE